MNTQIKSFLSTIALSLLLSGCGDESSNPVNPNQEDSIAFLKTGAYWIFQNTDKDEEGNLQKPDTDTDSILIGKQLTIDGKAAFEMLTYSKFAGETFIDTAFIRNEGQKILLKSQPLEDYEDMGEYTTPNLQQDWKLIADFSASTGVECYRFVADSTEINKYGKVKVMCEYTLTAQGNKSVQVAGNDILGYSFLFQTADTTIYNFSDRKEEWFYKSSVVSNLSPQIGFISFDKAASELITRENSNDEITKNNGYIIKTIRYHIPK